MTSHDRNDLVLVRKKTIAANFARSCAMKVNTWGAFTTASAEAISAFGAHISSSTKTIVQAKSGQVVWRKIQQCSASGGPRPECARLGRENTTIGSDEGAGTSANPA
jgi:hypothetical protein